MPQKLSTGPHRGKHREPTFCTQATSPGIPAQTQLSTVSTAVINTTNHKKLISSDNKYPHHHFQLKTIVQAGSLANPPDQVPVDEPGTEAAKLLSNM